MDDTLNLDGAPAPLPGPPLPGGKTRTKPYRPRNRKKSDPGLIRTAKLWLRLTPDCRRFIRRFAESRELDESLLVYTAVTNLAALWRFAEVPPPYDPKAAPEAPTLPGLDGKTG